MAGEHNFYGGSTYGLEPNYGEPISNYTPSGSIALALDARTANQLREVSNKLNTGGKAAEIQLTFPQVAESIPDTHLEEINRLRKLTGVDLTLHGPLVDPTGYPGEGQWDESKRIQAERQIWSAVERAHKINPEGNVVVTLHASNGLPEPETKEYNPKTGEEIKRIAVVNERTGQIVPLPAPRKEYLIEKEQEEKTKPAAYAELDRINRDQWLRPLSSLNLELQRAKEVLEGTLSSRMRTKDGRIVKIEDEKEKEAALKLFELHKQGKTEEFNKMMQKFTEKHPYFSKEEHKKELMDNVKNKIENLERADIFIRDSFNQFREMYNEAYYAVKNSKNNDKEKSIVKLNEIKDKITRAVDTKTGYLNDPKELVNFADTLTESIQKMNALKEIPKIYKPLKEWGIEKSAETFGNIAFNSYKKFGNTSPVISIENPPAGMGISRAEDLKNLIESSREVFKQKLMKEKNMSGGEAERQAEKLIGATWDVGHINMIRKYGYGDKQLKEETGKIAKFVKNIHLSDNFGYEHTELPMGMGNVPMKEHLEELKKAHGEKMSQIKQIIETGHWYQHFQTSPFAETLSAFGSPIYGMKMAPHWNQYKDTFAGYFAGYGMNPDIHHSLYGAGFSNLPPELGGQMAGRNRLSGAPME